MDGFDAFDSPPAGDAVEIDPAAEFLAQEQVSLGIGQFRNKRKFRNKLVQEQDSLRTGQCMNW